MTRVADFILKPPPSVTIVQRSWTSDVGSTVKSAKHWDTCMANKACKIIAIVFIAIAGLIVFWLLGSFFRCLRTGCEGWYSFFCWPCQCGNNRRSIQQQQQPMAPPPQYVATPQPQWNSNLAGQGNYYTNDRNRNDYGRVFEEDLELETQDFDLEAQKQKSEQKLKEKAKQDNSDTASWFSYNPFGSKTNDTSKTNINSNTNTSQAETSTYEEYNPFSKFSQNSNKH